MPPLHIELAEWEEKLPEAGSPLENNFLDDSSSQVLIKELSKKRMIEISERRQGLSIKATSYVGRITLGDIQITVKPKLPGMSFLSLLRYAYRFRDLKSRTTTELAHGHDSFLDLLVIQLLAEIKDFLSRGFHRKYIRKNQYLSSPRGRIDLQQIARHAGLTLTRLPCSHHPRLTDCLLNQILLAGLYLGCRVTTAFSLKSKCRRLAALIADDVSQIQLNRETWRQLNRETNRLTSAYMPAIALIKLLFESEGINLDKNDKYIKLPGFLFDMNRFFQVLLSRFLHENLHGYSLHDEYRLKGMISYINNPNKRKEPTPRPDYVVQSGSGTKVLAILDAKYRDIWNSALPREMLYQLSMYALSQIGEGKATILYPTLSKYAEEERIQIRKPLNGKNIGQVILRPVNLNQLNDLILNYGSRENERHRNEYAKFLAFGGCMRS